MYIVVRKGIDRCWKWSERDPVWPGLGPWEPSRRSWKLRRRSLSEACRKSVGSLSEGASEAEKRQGAES